MSDNSIINETLISSDNLNLYKNETDKKIRNYVENKISENIDDTLTKSGYSADSAAVGEKIDEIDGSISALGTEINQNKTDISTAKTDIQNLQNQDNVLSSRIDNLSTLAEGSTTGDAELADIRIGADGTAYPNAGTAVREQVSVLRQDLSNYGVVIPVDFTNIINGEYVTHSGTISEGVSFSRSEPILLEKGQKITFKATGYLTYVSMIAKYISDTKYQMLVCSIDSSEREYSYIAETDMYVVLSFETAKNHDAKIGIVAKDYCDNSIDDVKQSLSDYGVTRNVDFSTAIDGVVIGAGGWTGSSEGFSKSQPLKLYKGEKINLLATGYQTDIAMISEYTGTGYICLVPSEDNTEKHYSYTATKDMDIVISYRNLSTPKATINSNASVVPEQTLRKTFGKLGMFPRMAIIGDSLGSGSICDGEYVQDKYGSSWLSFLARKNGATARTHYSNGGICCKSWLTKYLTKMQNDNPFNAYFIALGTNDKYLNQYPLGDISDDSGTDSFVGYYKQIVDAVREKAPHAVIFCVSLYTLQGAYVPYSNMVSEIADLYDNCFFIDFANNSDIRIDNGSSDYVSDAHFTTLGYQYVASIIDRLVNNVIDENKSFFKFFAKNNSVGEQYED